MAKVDLASMLKQSLAPVEAVTPPLSDATFEVEPATPPAETAAEVQPATEASAVQDPEAHVAAGERLSGVADEAPAEAEVVTEPKSKSKSPRAQKKAKTTPSPEFKPAATTETAVTVPLESRAGASVIPGDEPATAPFAIELPIPINERLTAYRNRTRKSHHAVLLDAVETTYPDLPELIRKALGREEEAPAVSLFGRSSRLAAPAPVGLSEQKVIHRFRIRESNRQLLTELADSLGAPSRNFLIVTAYDAYLPHIH